MSGAALAGPSFSYGRLNTSRRGETDDARETVRAKKPSVNVREGAATLLVKYLSTLDGFVIVDDPDGPYHHMGATITDAILQAGTTYETVVRPRVKRIPLRSIRMP